MPDQNVECRLSRLERTHRLVLFTLLVGCVGSTFAAFRPAGPSVVQAERFELVDSSGHVHAELRISDDGEAGLYVMDDSSRVRISLAHSVERTALFIRDGAGDTRIGVAQFSHGGGGVALHGDQMKGAAVLYLKDRRGSLRVFDEDGAVQYQAP